MRDVLALAARTPAAGQLRVDLSLARGLSYYTGCIMEMTVPDLAGSLGGGGRYDDLVGMFLGQQVPAAGFSLGLERILVVMGERAMFPAHITATAADVLIAQWNAATAGDALALAHELRAGGLRVEVYPDADKLGKQFKYAASTGRAAGRGRRRRRARRRRTEREGPAHRRAATHPARRRRDRLRELLGDAASAVSRSTGRRILSVPSLPLSLVPCLVLLISFDFSLSLLP